MQNWTDHYGEDQPHASKTKELITKINGNAALNPRDEMWKKKERITNKEIGFK